MFSVTYFLLKGTVKDENKHSLESIKYCEEISHHNCPFVDKQQAKWPR